MKNLSRATRRKLMKHIKPGDTITWGVKACNYTVTRVTMQGVFVESYDGEYFVAWDHNVRNGTTHNEGGKGPITKVSK